MRGRTPRPSRRVGVASQLRLLNAVKSSPPLYLLQINISASNALMETPVTMASNSRMLTSSRIFMTAELLWATWDDDSSHHYRESNFVLSTILLCFLMDVYRKVAGRIVEC
jgi:hypothetical protein